MNLISKTPLILDIVWYNKRVMKAFVISMNKGVYKWKTIMI